MPGPTSECNPDHPYFRFTRRKIRSLKEQINGVLEDARRGLNETINKINTTESRGPTDDDYHRQITILGSNMFRYDIVVSRMEAMEAALSHNKFAKPAQEIIDMMKGLDDNIQEMRNIEHNIQVEMSPQEMRKLLVDFDETAKRLGVTEWDMNAEPEVEGEGKGVHVGVDENVDESVERSGGDSEEKGVALADHDVARTAWE